VPPKYLKKIMVENHQNMVIDIGSFYIDTKDRFFFVQTFDTFVMINNNVRSIRPHGSLICCVIALISSK
jgi:hypothetical protein